MPFEIHVVACNSNSEFDSGIR